jgi:hypothetical protein
MQLAVDFFLSTNCLPALCHWRLLFLNGRLEALGSAETKKIIHEEHEMARTNYASCRFVLFVDESFSFF